MDSSCKVFVFHVGLLVPVVQVHPVVGPPDMDADVGQWIGCRVQLPVVVKFGQTVKSGKRIMKVNVPDWSN